MTNSITVTITSRAVCIAAACFLLGPAPAVQAEVTLTNTTNIRLSHAQVESGGDTSENPDVTSRLGVDLIAFSDDRPDHYNCCGNRYEAINMRDGDVGAGRPSDGFYAIPNAGPAAVELSFSKVEQLSGIVIYNGYGNRDNGTYTLKDMNGTVHGAWTITNTGGGTNDGVDSFWLTFKTPVSTNKLVIDTTSTEGNQTNSFREIQVLGINAPPIRLAVIGDSYTVGFGDKCPPAAAAECSDLPVTPEFVANYSTAPVMQPCGYKFGWAPKLEWLLQQRGRNASVVGICAQNGATSASMLQASCGSIIAGTNPTHTIIFAGINDPKGVEETAGTWMNVSRIGAVIDGLKIHIQGNGELPAWNWTQSIPNDVFVGGFPKPCRRHPDSHGYWHMANQLVKHVRW